MKKNSVLLSILIILVLILIVGGFFYIKNISDKQDKILDSLAEENIEETNEIKEENSMNLTAETNKNIEDETKTQVNFNPDKVIPENEYVLYEEDMQDRITSGLDVKVSDGRVFFSTDIEDDSYKLSFSDLDLEEIKDKEITGFDVPVEKVHLAYMGNGDMAPILLFLMKDGSVEYLESRDMLENENYKSSGKLGNLSDIVKFTNVTITDLDENGETLGGAIGVVAIDKDGISYDIANVGNFY